jgi:hypothetical protein
VSDELTTAEAAALVGRSYFSFLRWARRRGVASRTGEPKVSVPLFWRREDVLTALQVETAAMSVEDQSA